MAVLIPNEKYLTWLNRNYFSHSKNYSRLLSVTSNATWRRYRPKESGLRLLQTHLKLHYSRWVKYLKKPTHAIDDSTDDNGVVVAEDDDDFLTN